MASRFEELLVDLAGQVRGVERLLSTVLENHKDLARQVADIRERLAKLEKGEEWNGEERRKVGERLGTGDHTFEKLKYEISAAEKKSLEAVAKADAAVKTANAVLGKVEEMRKTKTRQEERASSRMWYLIKLIAKHAVPLIVALVGSYCAIKFGFPKGG